MNPTDTSMVEISQWRAAIGSFYCVSCRASCRAPNEGTLKVTAATRLENHQQRGYVVPAMVMGILLIQVSSYILLSGDVETNPGPITRESSQFHNP